MANDVKITATGHNRSRPMFDEIVRDTGKVEKATEGMGSRGVGKAESAFGRLSEVAGRGSVVLAGVAGTAMAVDKVMGDGIAVSLAKANAEVALGADGFRVLTDAAAANANTMGFTQNEFIATAGSAASLAKNLGFSQEAAAKLGATFPDLADKLVTLSNGKVSAAEAADQLRSAMAGEFDPLQAMGIAINAAAVETEALKIQQQSATKITKEQATAMAVLAIVQRQTADASKVMATEAGRSAAEAQAAQAELKEAYEDLSEEAVPALREITQATAGWAQSWRELFSSSTPFMERVGSLVNVLAPMTNLVDAVKEKTGAAGAASKAASLDVLDLAEGATVAADSQEDLAKATQEAVDAIKSQISAVLEGRDAARGYQESLDAATEALQSNGKTLDITTEKGRENSAALDAIARSALEQAEAVREAGGSEADFQGQLERSRAALERQAVRFGMTKSEARAYSRQVLGIPKRADTKVFLDDRGAIRKIDAVRIKMARLDGTVADVFIRATGGRFAVDIAQSRGEHRTGGVAGGAFTAASGGARSGTILAGEEGPELIGAGAGAFVRTAGETQRMLGRMGGGVAHGVLEINTAGSDLDELLVMMLQRAIRHKGGNVQVVLGTRRGSLAVS